MSKKRSIDTHIRLDEDFADLTYRQRDLWHGLIATADDQGRLPGHPGAVRSMVWPMDNISLDDVLNDLRVLASDKHGYIYLYDVDGKSYIQIVNWWKHQRMQWAGTSDFPSPDGWLDRCRYQGLKHKVITVNWDTPGGFCLSAITNENVNVNDKVNVNVNPDKSGDFKGEFKGNKSGGFPFKEYTDWIEHDDPEESAVREIMFAVAGPLGNDAVEQFQVVEGLIQKHGAEKTKAGLQEAYSRWISTKSKSTGKPYSSTNYKGWVDWAVSFLNTGQKAWSEPGQPNIGAGIPVARI